MAVTLNENLLPSNMASFLNTISDGTFIQITFPSLDPNLGDVGFDLTDFERVNAAFDTAALNMNLDFKGEFGRDALFPNLQLWPNTNDYWSGLRNNFILRYVTGTSRLPTPTFNSILQDYIFTNRAQFGALVQQFPPIASMTPVGEGYIVESFSEGEAEDTIPDQAPGIIDQIRNALGGLLGPNVAGVPIGIWLVAAAVIIPPIARAASTAIERIPGGER